MVWPKVQYNGESYYQSQGVVLVPEDGSGVAIVMLKEDGGIVGGVSAIEKGDPGIPPDLAEAINFTPLEPGDATPDSASWSLLTPGTPTTAAVYKLNLALHKGGKGDSGTMQWNPADLSGTPVAKQIPQVKSDLSGFELVAQRITEVFYPGSINNIGSGNPSATQAAIAIPARPWARRIRANGFTVVTGEAADVRVNLLARLNGETDGNIVGRCVGIAQTERLTLSPGKPIQAGTEADGYDTIAAGASATVHIRCERVAGSSTYTTTAAMSQYSVEALPL